MEFITILAFFTMCFGIGYFTRSFLSKTNIVDTILQSSIIGLALTPVMIILFRLLHLPLDIRLFCAASIMLFAIGLWRMHEFETPTVKRSAVLGIVLLIMIIFAAFMYAGATKYPYLEDDDPWEHATGASFIANEKTTVQPEKFSHYLEPYPPFFTAVMGMLNQTSDDLRWILKFFNAIMIGMSLIAAFYMFEMLLQDSTKAAIAIAILAALPAYMSHFIWSQSLAMPILFTTIYSLELIRMKWIDDSTTTKWWMMPEMWIASILVFSLAIIQPSVAGVGAILLATYCIIVFAFRYFTANRQNKHDTKQDNKSAKEENKASKSSSKPASIKKKTFLPIHQMMSMLIGGMLGAAVWITYTIIYGWTRVAEQIGIRADMFTDKVSDTSGGIVYSLMDIIIPPSSSKIDQATGLGLAVSILVLIGIIIMIVQWKKIFTNKNIGLLVLFAFLIIGILGIEGNALPFKIFPHRFWVFLAIPVAGLAAETIVLFSNAVKETVLKYAIIVFLLSLVLATSVPARMQVQQAMWPPGAHWNNYDEITAYSQLESSIPQGSRVFTMCGEEKKLIGNNMVCDMWTQEYKDFKKDAAQKNIQEIIGFMKQHDYEYMSIDYGCIKTLGENRTQALLNDIGSSGRFTTALNTKALIVVKLKR